MTIGAIAGFASTVAFFHVWARIDADHSAIRLVTSWATKEDAVQAFIADLGKPAS